MMDDKTMLELAAKAADVPGEWTDSHIQYDYQLDAACDPESGITDGGGIWNPLTNDGDALRLAVKLGMEVNTDHGGDYIYIVAACGMRGVFSVHEDSGDDPYAATRRAITRAAAIIGEKKQ